MFFPFLNKRECRIKKIMFKILIQFPSLLQCESMDRIMLICSGFPLYLWLILLLVSLCDGEYWNETNNFGDFGTKRAERKIRPFKNNLLTFDTKDNNIEVAFEFSVPFISIPVKRSIDAVKNTVLVSVKLAFPTTHPSHADNLCCS